MAINDEIRISVNGREHVLDGAELNLAQEGKITYEQIVRMARFDAGTPEREQLLTVTFSTRTFKERCPCCGANIAQGCLSPGQSVKAVEGMYFSCVDTSNA